MLASEVEASSPLPGREKREENITVDEGEPEKFLKLKHVRKKFRKLVH